MRMENTPIIVKTLLGSAKIPRNFSFQVGDTVILDQKIEDPLIIEIEGKKRLLGYPGEFQQKKAVKISSKVMK